MRTLIKGQSIGYTYSDLVAAKNLLNLHMAKLQKAVDANDYPTVCSALRAMQDECENGGRIAAQLSLRNHLDRSKP
jgi:hypothetical protein